MIHAEQLSRRFGGQQLHDGYAVRDLSFHVRRGEVMGLLGPNGAGKSTTMKILTCFIPPSSGSARIGGVGIEDARAVRRLLGYLPENAPSYSDLDVTSHLRFIGRMHGLPSATLRDRIRELATVCGLEAVLHRRIDELSKGYRQRVGLAASMLHDPDCLILDEPTTGLDPNQIIEIRHLIRRLGEKKTVLLSSHVLSEVEAVCDRMMIIDGGRLQAVGTREELARQAQGGSILHVCLRGDAERFAEAIRERLRDCVVEIDADETGSEQRLRLHHPDADAPLAESAFHTAVAQQAVLLELRRQQTSLEDVFHKITGVRS